MTSLDLERLRRVASEFPDARLVVLFGSVARGQPTSWSDAASDWLRFLVARDGVLLAAAPIVRRCTEGARRRLLAGARRG